MGWALTRKCRHHHDLLVLVNIANVARDGWTFIAQPTLAKRCMISRKSVNESLKRLHEDGYIARFERWVGNVRSSDHIQILPPHRCNASLLPPVTSGYTIPSRPYGLRKGIDKGLADAKNILAFPSRKGEAA